MQPKRCEDNWRFRARQFENTSVAVSAVQIPSYDPHNIRWEDSDQQRWWADPFLNLFILSDVNLDLMNPAWSQWIRLVMNLTLTPTPSLILSPLKLPQQKNFKEKKNLCRIQSTYLPPKTGQTSAGWLVPPSLRANKDRSVKSLLFSVLVPQWRNTFLTNIRTAVSLAIFRKRLRKTRRTEKRQWKEMEKGLMNGKFIFKTLLDGFVDRTKVICTYCRHELSYHWSTLRIKYHLQAKHTADAESPPLAMSRHHHVLIPFRARGYFLSLLLSCMIWSIE